MISHVAMEKMVKGKITQAVFLVAIIFADLCWANSKIHDRKAEKQPNVHDVMDYGAVGDGCHDDSQAFLKAWGAACETPSDAEMVVPSGKKFLVNPSIFFGPCKSSTSVHIEGEIISPAQKSQWKNIERPKWLQFSNISDLTVDGGGRLDGQGRVWWESSCKVNKSNPCTHAPTAMYIVYCKNVVVKNLRFLNSQQVHLGINYTSQVQISRLHIRAPKKSPNTDGIHLEGVTDAQINNCDIGTGDDCISISSPTSNVSIQKIKCGPGHGVSVGSLGRNGEPAKVEKINVRDVVFHGSDNGARIKTWQGGAGYAREIAFANIRVHNVSNPIIINQYYCDSPNPCPVQKSAVQIEDVTFENIKGTSMQEEAVKFNCSQTVPCKGIIVRKINLRSKVRSQTKSVCVNAYGSTFGKVHPDSCLLK